MNFPNSSNYSTVFPNVVITGRAFQRDVIDELELNNCTSDTILFYKSAEEQLIGICTAYVEDASKGIRRIFQKFRRKLERPWAVNKSYDSDHF